MKYIEDDFNAFTGFVVRLVLFDPESGELGWTL
jgi:hypothetical protein